MVLVKRIDIVNEGVKKVLFIQTEEGSFSQVIDIRFAEHIASALANRSFYNHDEVLDIVDSCCLCKDELAILDIHGRKMQTKWEDGLSEALVSDSHIYLDSELLKFEYFNDNVEDKLFIEDLIEQEKVLDESQKIKKMVQALYQAIEEERFEDAAVLRDKLEQYDMIKSNVR